MADPQQVASAFCNHYYSTFTQGVESLAGLYVRRVGSWSRTWSLFVEGPLDSFPFSSFSIHVSLSSLFYFCWVAVVVAVVSWFLPNLRSRLFLFQNEKSMLTFEGSQFQGTQAILTKLSSIGRVQHTVKSMDVQPSADPNSLVVFITGSVQIDGGNPLHFCEFFQLVSNSPGSYYVHNDIFRLNYGL